MNCIKENLKSYRFGVFKIKELKPGFYGSSDPLQPYPRSGHRIVVYKGNIYSCGGYNSRDPETNEVVAPDLRTLFAEVWKFNLASKVWTKLVSHGPMPSELASHTAVLVDNYMIVHGGTGVMFGELMADTTYICDLKTVTWSVLPTDGDKPPPLYGQAATVYENKLYIVGGTTGFTFFITVHVLDLLTKIWTRLDNINKHNYQPRGRYRHEIAIQNNKLYVFGGGTQRTYFDFKEIPVFDLDKCMWEIQESHLPDSVSLYPFERSCHSCVHVGDDVYICGGIRGSGNMQCIWKLNLNDFLWTKLDTSLPIPLHFHSAAVTQEGQMLIFGGITNTEEEIRINDVYSMWLKIPSLSDICWEALLTFIPNLATFSKEKLFEAGFPIPYLDKVEFIVTPLEKQK